MPQEPQEPDWKNIAQASMQQRDEANRNLCNLQIEMAIMADKLKQLQDEAGVKEASANNGVDKQIVKPAKSAVN